MNASTYILFASFADAVKAAAWPAALVFVTGIAAFVFYRIFTETKKIPGETLNKIGEIAEKFKKGTITETFIAAVPRLVPDGSGNYEVATLEAPETFRKQDELKILWGLLSLGETVTTIRCLVTYRFHVRMRDPWLLDVQGNTVIVSAPQVRPSLPPAIHTDKMEIEQKEGWLRFNAGEQKDALIKNLTPRATEYGSGHLSSLGVIENARKEVGELIRLWLLKENHWRDGRFTAIVVQFPNEVGKLAAGSEPVCQFDHVQVRGQIS